MTDHDASDEITYCVRVTEAAGLAKLIYYGAKILQLLRSAPIPPPPV